MIKRLFPRHKTVLNAINRYGSCCDPLLSQATGVCSAWEVAQELAKEGYLCWTRRSRFSKYNTHRPPGWTLTDKGKMVAECNWCNKPVCLCKCRK